MVQIRPIGRSSFRVDVKVNYLSNGAKIALESEQLDPVIRYTTDGTVPTAESPLYMGPFRIKERCQVMAALFRGDTLMESPTIQWVVPQNQAYRKQVEYVTPRFTKYRSGGAMALTDGKYGDKFRVNENWQGFEEKMEVVIDLEKVRDLKQIDLGFLQMTERKMLFPERLEVSSSNDGNTYSLVKIYDHIDPDERSLAYENFPVRTGGFKARYLKISA